MHAVVPPHRVRCYTCFRPIADCYCATLPKIANRTEVLILQHRRERFHPFNTARIVRHSLLNSTFLVDHTPRLAEQLRLRPHAGLLFPGAEAALITDVPIEQRPAQLVVVDGTWHQAKTLVRDIPALRNLPRYRLAPVEPSNYRIRREPNALALSTVEAVVAALRVFEPETRGFDELLAAFHAMIDRQLAHPKADEKARRQLAQRHRTLHNVPLALGGDLANIVVAYGECLPGERGVRRGQQSPLVWVAERLVSGERFASTIRPDETCQESLDDVVLQHLELTREDFASAPTLAAARRAWKQFLRPGDVVAVYSPSTARLLQRLNDDAGASCLVLKGIDFHAERHYESLDDLALGEELVVEPAWHPGRAGRRLANVKALTHHLHAMVNAYRTT